MYVGNIKYIKIVEARTNLTSQTNNRSVDEFK